MNNFIAAVKDMVWIITNRVIYPCYQSKKWAISNLQGEICSLQPLWFPSQTSKPRRVYAYHLQQFRIKHSTIHNIPDTIRVFMHGQFAIPCWIMELFFGFIKDAKDFKIARWYIRNYYDLYCYLLLEEKWSLVCSP